MKNLMLISLAVMVSLVQLNAQEETVDTKYIIGGAFSYLHQTNNAINANNFLIGVPNPNTGSYDVESTYSVFSFSPYVGRVITSRWTLGLSLDLRFSKTAIEPAVPTVLNIDFTTTTRQVGFGIFSRYHFNPSKRFQFFLQPYVQYYQTKQEGESNSVVGSKEEAKHLELGITPGILYQIQKHFRMTVRFGGIAYLNGSTELTRLGQNTLEQDFDSFTTNFNLSSLFLGAEWNF